MKANSPICVSEKLHCMAVFSGWPESRKPPVLNKVCPSMIAKMIQRMGTMCCPMRATSTIIPTDTKKMAPKRSLTGLTRCSIFSASTVSARILPMMNAPKAGENPTEEASTTIPKQSPRDTMTIVSSLISRLVFLRISGMR